MKKVYASIGLALVACAAQAQTTFPGVMEPGKTGATPPRTIVVPPSPLKTQVLFIGGTDDVAHKALPAKNDTIYGESAGVAKAKEWHDFLGFTPASDIEKASMATKGHENFLGWLSSNHETVYKDNKLGDGGGMTVFAIKRQATTDSIIVIPQDLSTEGFPAGEHKFFNVDFAGTVGETGMNCGGITSEVDGRIWTAEEWFRGNNNDIHNANNIVGSAFFPTLPTGTAARGKGVRDTAMFTIKASEFAGTDYHNQVIPKYKNFNWMVEIDPRKGKAIRKQFNWGRQGFEGGVITSDNKTVYLGEDGSPGLFTKFVADVAGDFTKGKTYVYKYDADMTPDNNWIEIKNASLDSMLNITKYAWEKGATPFCRAEWVAYNKNTGKVYFTETGNDNWFPAAAKVTSISKPMIDFFRMRSTEMGKNYAALTDLQIADSLKTGKFRLNDYYGRITEYDPTTGKIRTFLEGGPYLPTGAPAATYPNKHFTNPDGLGMFYLKDKTYLIIQEDLNGRTFGRVPNELAADNQNNICEMFLLDMSIANPTVNDLFKVAATPYGAEITGARALPDGKTLLFNAQHPNTSNPFPYNHSMTVAITGWDQIVTSLNDQPSFTEKGFAVYPNPASRELHLNKVQDVAIYNQNGIRVKVSRNSDLVNIADLTTGIYFITNQTGETLKLVIK